MADLGPFEEMSSTTRRGLIGGVVGLGALGFFGLQLFDGASGADPEVPEDDLEEEGWTEYDDSDAETERQLGPLTLTSKASTIRYKDEELIQRVKHHPVQTDVDGRTRVRELSSYTDGAFSDPLRVFTATRIDLNPNVDDLPAGIGLQQIMDKVTARATTRFENEMENSGLEEIERDGEEELEIDTGETATRFDYSAVYGFEGITTTVEGTDVRLPAKDLEIAGHLAFWDHGDFILVAAGVYPNENYAETVEETGQYGQDITLSLDLELQPDDYEEETLDLMAQVE